MKRVLVTFAALALIMSAFSGTSYAAEMDYPFAVEIIVPDNNIDQKGYYHLPGNPGETIILQARLVNLTSQPIEISAVPLNAYTGLDGICYQSPADVDAQAYALADKSYGLAQYIKTVDSVYLLANTSMVTDITVHVPDMNEGTLLGGIRFAVFAGTQQAQNADVNGSTILFDQYLAIDTAIQIDLPGTVQPLVTAGTPNLTDRGIYIPIVNAAALIQENVSGTFQIKDSTQSLLIEGNAVLPKMAPMSEARIFQPWDIAWEKGDYTLSMQISANGQSFEFTKPFSIGEEAISQMAASQQNAVDAQSTTQVSGITAAADTQNTASIQKIIINVLVIGIPLVFACILVWIHKKNRNNMRRAEARQIAGKRYAGELK